MINSVPPPPGYASWLDYAVDHFDTRNLQLDQMFSCEDVPGRQAMRDAARAELSALRAQASPQLSKRDPP